MSRTYMVDGQLKDLTDRLVMPYLKYGSVNKVCEALNTVSATKIYPNRLHSLLGNNSTRAINDSTLVAISEAIDDLPIGIVSWKDVKSTLDKHVADSPQELATLSGVPIAVVRFIVGEDETINQLQQLVTQSQIVVECDGVERILNFVDGRLVVGELREVEKQGVESVLKAIGKGIRDRRKSAGMNLAQLSEQANMSLGYLSQIELGKNSPSIETLYNLAQVFGVKLSELIVEK